MPKADATELAPKKSASVFGQTKQQKSLHFFGEVPERRSLGHKTRKSPGRFCRTLLLLPSPCWDTSSAYTAEYPIPLTVAALDTPALPRTAILGNMPAKIMRTSRGKIVTHYNLPGSQACVGHCGTFPAFVRKKAARFCRAFAER